MKISIVIPAYNEEKYIGKALGSILASASEGLLEVIVVNNASTDKTVEIASAFAKVRVVNEPNKGLTRARQAGLNAAQGEVLAYIDADTKVNKQWFSVLAREFAKDSSLGCLSGPYYYYDLFEDSNRFSRWWRGMWVNIWQWFIYHITDSKKGYVIHGGNFAAKKSTLLAAGGFDTEIEFYGEDTDIARRLRQQGKIKWSNDFYVDSSARRFKGDGLIRTGVRYLLNYLSVVFFKRPVLKKYTDIR